MRWAPDVVRFMMLFRKNEAPLDFDFAKVTEQSKDNPVFYVQYAHARICSVLRNAAAEGLQPGRTGFASAYGSGRTGHHPADWPSIHAVWRPQQLPMSRTGSPFISMSWLAIFTRSGTKAKSRRNCDLLLKDDVETTITRLAFLRAIRYVLANGLRILGVRPVDEM